MSEGQPPPGAPLKSTPGRRVLQGIYMAVAIGVALTVTDAFRESLGRLAAMGLGILAGLLAAWVAQSVVWASQRRRDRA
jgi:hypothetical protein